MSAAAITVHYSAEKRGFFLSGTGVDIPADAVEITAERRADLLAAQAAGSAIVPDENGYPIAAEQPAPDPEIAMQLLRDRRARLLRQSDFTQIPDAPFTEEQRAAWATYRQALRDLPETFSDPATVVWPVPPA